MTVDDPFGTAALRSAVLVAWRDSPTRLREDAATEADLVRAGYRDRLLTELAQNAADAAVEAGVPGRLTVELRGRVLSIANTGVPLGVDGVHALTALRASDKVDPEAVDVAVDRVGRFGVGFTAVLSVSDDIEIRSTTGSLRFSREWTRAALDDNEIKIPGRSKRAVREFAAPVLRLAWPVADGPAPGSDTEIVLRLREDIDADALLESMRAEAADLLIELPALRAIRIGDDEITSTAADLANGLQELRVTGPGDESRTWWQFRTARARWLVPVREGRPFPAANDVLRAPTRSDEELSLPALLIADIPMQPDRRRLLPGARLSELATGYSDFARALPRRDRLVLVPTPGFARGETDAALREAVLRDLRTHPWLPVLPPPTTPPVLDADPFTLEPQSPSPSTASASSRTATTGDPDSTGAAFASDPMATPVDATDSDSMTFGSNSAATAPESVVRGPDTAETGPESVAIGSEWAATVSNSAVDDLELTVLGSDAAVVTSNPLAADPDPTAIPTRASVLIGLGADLAELLADVIGPLVVPELSRPGAGEALAALDVHRLGLARLAELSGGLERAPRWWYGLYEALEPFVADPLAAEELGALAVPLTDGRVVTGPRTVVLGEGLELAVGVPWARLVHPEAAHPLLARLGARTATPEDLLSDPALRAELEEHPDDPDIADAVLRLAASAEPRLLPEWLGQLELPDTEGELRPADELLLPDAPLYPLLVSDTPLGTLAADVVAEYGAQALRAIGVGWDFGVVSEVDPTGPDHDLDDEETWWDGLAEEPRELVAVRDLDLVDEIAWPDALLQLVSEPATRRLLTDPDGYTAWWLRRHARVRGTRLGLYRHPADSEFAGLLPEFTFGGFEQADLDGLRSVFVNPDAMSVDLVAALLDALADESNTPEPEVVSRVHALLARAVDDGRIDPTDLDLPERVRALSGAAVDPEAAMVLDLPWFGLVAPSDRLVLGDADTAAALARLLDLPLVSDAISAEVLGAGRATSWSAEPLGVVFTRLFGLPAQDGDLVVHEDLRVRLSGAVSATVTVPWWRVGATTHIGAPRAVEVADDRPALPAGYPI
ncbi:sacsin N-terminal ATP-binding-like domain-containing protein [Nocardia bovistercoris]|uniref:sacsin N-terminal ATP-binding-like domain-containing protein n=1 Tax=Nocardia bovistercoris TaxID=2785916 RepID=UPI001E3E9D9E|nr:ATP-binding protein [Nocardia bovistercoris]